MIKFVVVASRGRNPDNPADRHSGIHTEQRLESNDSGVTNTITSVAKDNWVLEIYDKNNTDGQFNKN